MVYFLTAVLETCLARNGDEELGSALAYGRDIG